jgi:hypothetical protein
MWIRWVAAALFLAFGAAEAWLTVCETVGNTFG